MQESSTVKPEENPWHFMAHYDIENRETNVDIHANFYGDNDSFSIINFRCPAERFDYEMRLLSEWLERMRVQYSKGMFVLHEQPC